MRAAERIGGGVILAGLVLGVGLRAPPAQAQLVLPGAVAPTPEGASQEPDAPVRAPATRSRVRGPAASKADAEEPSPKGTVVAVPAATALSGHSLALNGGGSQMDLSAPADGSLAVTRLSLSGDQTANTLQTCTVDVPAASLPVTALGRADGLERYRIEYPACPIEFSILDGAVLVDRAGGDCTIESAACRVHVGGLWGPTAAELGPDRVKSLEKARGVATTAVRSNYKALTLVDRKNRPAVMGFARDQAQFSSTREEICRDYAEDGRHGFCATVLTEARAVQLYDRLGVALAEKAARKAKLHAKR